jgi:hypothetical protein
LVARVGRGREHCARMGFFVGCKSWERKRALCENEIFCWLQELRKEEGAGRKGDIYGPRNPFNHY